MSGGESPNRDWTRGYVEMTYNSMGTIIRDCLVLRTSRKS